MSKTTTTQKASILFGLLSLVMFGVWAFTDHMAWALLSVFYAITSSEYKIRAEIEKGRK